MPEFRIVATGLGFTEGPVWTRDARLVITSISHGAIYEITDDGADVVGETGGGPNGMAEGRDGTLYIAQNGGFFGTGDRTAEPTAAGIQELRDGTARYLAEGLDAPNDLCFGPDGRVYFTDPRGGATAENRRPGRVYAMALDGAPELLAEGPRFTNGIAFDADASRLYVAETFGRRVLAYPFADGALGEPDEFCTTEPGFPDGMCFDTDGNLYVAATLAGALHVYDHDGRRIEQLACGENSMPTNCCFGGADGRTLFVTDSRGERVLAFDLPTQGLLLFPFR